ncbi:alpha/beta fold hydrolase [Paenibacillus sp. MBLB4367]|uniref:alpha/beta fold hydrolase n=1 Tax=Paenibacillus sp. MBLB4367 TaxID=3384767 RepID=UPI003907E849
MRAPGEEGTMGEEIAVFRSGEGREAFLQAYEETMKLWSVPYETLEWQTDYGRCHVIASGPAEGKTVLLLHGMTGSSGLWYATIPALQAYRTYCVDVPGDFGRSTVTRPLRDAGDCAHWIDQLFEAAGADRAALIGHSMGGWLAANYALARPERVERLALLAPVGTFLPMPLLKMLRRVYPALLLPKPKRIERAWQWFCAKGGELHPVVMKQIIEAYTHCRIRMKVIPRVFPKEAWNGLKTPVLFLAGAEEVIYDADKAAKAAASVLPHVRTVIVSRAGHCLIAEQAELVNAELADFLDVTRRTESR